MSDRHPADSSHDAGPSESTGRLRLVLNRFNAETALSDVDNRERPEPDRNAGLRQDPIDADYRPLLVSDVGDLVTFEQEHSFFWEHTRGGQLKGVRVAAANRYRRCR